MRTALVLAISILSLPASATDLGIQPVAQRTPSWCWAAVGEMVFRHYGVANINPGGDFQCGIVALTHPVCNQNCYNCPVPAGSLETMNNMLTRYPVVANQVTGASPQISTRVTRTPLSWDLIRREIDYGRPVVAGVSPSGYRIANLSEHVVLIVGYNGSDLIVNDPFPYQADYFRGDPYIAAGGYRIRPGQYGIDYRAFLARLKWGETIYGVRCRDGCGGQGRGGPRAELGRSCITPVTRCGPFYDQPEQPIGTPCWCATPYGPSSGRVVR